MPEPSDGSHGRRADDRHLLLFRTLPLGVVFVNAEGAIEAVNPAAEEILGATNDELHGRPLIDPSWRVIREDGTPFPDDERPAMVTLRTGREVNGVVMGVFNPKRDQMRWVRVRSVPVFERGGTTPDSVYTFFEDITGGRQTAARAEAAARLFESVVEHSPHPVYIKDRERRYLVANRATAIALGAPPDEIIGKTNEELIAPEAAARLLVDDLRVLAGETVTVDAEPRQGVSYEVTKFPRRNAAGDVIGIVAIARDVTREKQLQAQLFEAQKMEALGRLAGGVAHDFNNLLTVILGFVESLKEHLADRPAAAEDARELAAAARRGAELTSQLLYLAKNRPSIMQVIDLERLLAGMQRLLTRTIGEDITLTLDIQRPLPPVRGDAGMLEQVLLNLATNARDAMSSGGALRIEASAVVVGRGALVRPRLPDGTYARIRVTDAGNGMSREVLSHLFEPFFTTKGAKGTGLGLATAYGIVKQHQGDVWGESEEGSGSTFTILLPATADVVPASAQPPLPAPAAGSEAVLLVEDDASIRRLVERSLTRMGYAVTSASDPAEAEAIVAGGGTFELLITDVVMPGSTGPDMASRIRALLPEIKVLFMSGYTEHGGVTTGDIPVEQFLQKPFTPNQLARRVRAVLDSSR